MEAQFTLYKAGILDAEVWDLRRGYAKAILNNYVIKNCWESDKSNSMFTKKFIDSIDGTSNAELPAFIGLKQ